MRLTKFIILFVICTLAISIAIPAFAARRCRHLQGEMRRLPWPRGSGQNRSGREGRHLNRRPDH